MKKHLYFILLLLPIIASRPLPAQEVYQHVSDKNIYHFIDELANAGFIRLNSAVKPYSRMFIAESLEKADADREKLNKRQQKELDFYLLDYKLETDSLPDYNPTFDLFGNNKNLATAVNPLGIYYKDKLLTMSVKPVWGINYFINENGTIYHRWGGGEAYAYVGKHWAFYASLRDNNETKRISSPDYFTLREGGAYKGTPGGGGDYSEMRGGVVYSWKWGSFGLVKDHINWGNNEHGPMIFSDRPPSFAQIKLKIRPAKWFELNYFHGWLVSMEIDSARSYFAPNPPREVYRPKYVAANLFTFTPWKGLDLSIGNSIIYSDMNVHPAYLIPVMFYKSIDHTLNEDIDNQNSQMFLDVSIRNIKNIHLYGTLFIDELKTERLTDPKKHNFWSGKAGIKTTNLGIQNVWINFEYAMSRPITYQHRVPTLTFASNDYNFGWYMRDNSREIYAAVGYKPLRGLHLRAYYLLAQHGPDYEYIIGDPTIKVDEYPFLSRITWQNQTVSFKASWEFINNAYIFAEYLISDITGNTDYVEKYTPEFFRGKTNTVSAGFNIGF